MRKKRAQTTGAVVVDTVERLKPGRKPKKAVSVDDLRAQAATDAPSSPTIPRDMLRPPGPSPSQDGHVVENARKSTDDKRRMKLASKGVDVQRLRREGFGLFHLRAISKLMQYVTKPSPPSGILTSVLVGHTTHSMMFRSRLGPLCLVRHSALCTPSSSTSSRNSCRVLLSGASKSGWRSCRRRLGV